MTTHPSHRLWAEVVRIAFHLHWSLDSVLDFEHPVRRQVLAEVLELTGGPPDQPGPGGEWR